MSNYITLSKQAKFIFNKNNQNILAIYTPLKHNLKKKTCIHTVCSNLNEKEQNNMQNDLKKNEFEISRMIKTYVLMNNIINPDHYIIHYQSIISETINYINKWGKISKKNILNVTLKLTKIILNNYPLNLLKSIENLKKLISYYKFSIMNIHLVYANSLTSINDNVKKSLINLYENNVLCVINTPTIISVFTNDEFSHFKVMKYDEYSIIQLHKNITFHKYNIENILKFDSSS